MKIQSTLTLNTIIQCLNSFISKHVELKKPIAIAVAVWMLSGIPIHINADWDQFWDNVDDEWELIEPNGNKDYTYSFYALLGHASSTYWATNLAYLGKDKDEHLFIGINASWNFDKLIIHSWVERDSLNGMSLRLTKREDLLLTKREIGGSKKKY